MNFTVAFLTTALTHCVAEKVHKKCLPLPHICHPSPSSSGPLLIPNSIPLTSATRTVIHPQLPSIHHLLLQMLLRLLCRGDIDEIRVRETPRLAGAAVDGYADVEDVADLAEEIYCARQYFE